MSEIFDALTVAQDRAVERLFDRRRESDITVEVEPLPTRVELSHHKIRNFLIVAFLGLGLALAAKNYVFSPNGVLVKGQPVDGVVFEGTIHPASEVSITADLGGTVSDIFVKVGDTILKGQQLLRMDDREATLNLNQATVELQAAESQFDKFRAQLAEANARLAVSQSEEQQVPTRQLRDSPERAAAAYDLAMSTYSRAKELGEAGLISKQEVEARAADLRIAADDLENAKKLAGVSAKLERDQADQADLQAKVTRETLQQQLDQAQLNYQRAKEQAEGTLVRATEAGVVSEIPLHLGDHVPGGTVLVRLAKLDHLIAEVPVAARTIAELKVGQAAQVGLPSSPPSLVEGRIRVINPLPSPNMTHIVEVEFDNPTLLLLAGQAAEVRFSKR